MTDLLTTAALPDEDTTTVTLRPRYEGANIRTWIGFKHFQYLVEEAVLTWFRERGHGPSRLFHEYGLGLALVDSSIQLPAVLDMDDEVRATVTPAGPGRFAVRLVRVRDGVRVLRGRVRVALVRVADGSVPDELASLVAGSVPDDDAEPPAVGSAFTWSWRAPYFYCQFSDRVQHSGYVRAMEEVVDRFLADRGISVGRMLAERGWIPVVSRARLRMLADAWLEETVRTTFTVTEVVKERMFAARVDFAVCRDGDWVTTAQGDILHGYAVSRGPDAGRLAELDPGVVDALTGTSR